MATQVLTSWGNDEFSKDGKIINWNWNNWETGTPITQTKLENLEEGIAILATQMSAIFAELDTATYSNLINNSSRIDNLAKEVWGSNTTSGTSRIDKNENKIAAIAAELGGTAPDGSSTTYNGATRLDDLEKEIGGTRVNGYGYQDSKINVLESTVSTHTNELTAIKNELGGSISGSTYGGTTRLDSVITKASSIATEIWGSDTVSGDSRIDKLTIELYGSNITDYSTISKLDSTITKLSTITTELYGSDNTSITSRLDDLEKELCGTTITRDTTNGGYSNSRIDNIESINSTQSTDISSLKTRTTAIETLNTTQNNRLTAIEDLNTNQNTRLGNIETHDASVDKAIIAIKNELGGTYVENSGFTNSRIDTLESTSTSYGTRLNNIENKNTAQDNKLAAIMSELGGTGNDGSNTTYGGTSRLDSVITEVWGSNTTTGNSRIDNIETLNTAQNTRLNSIEALDTIQNGRLDSVESMNSAQNNKLTVIATEIWGSDTTSGNSKLDTIITELYGSNDTTIASRLDDLEKEICGETIERTTDGTGYENSRIDGLELKVGNGAIGVDADISAAIRRLSDTVAALDPTGSAEATLFLVNEVWGQNFSEDTDFTADSRIDILENVTSNLGNQITTLATEQSALEQDLAATRAKIPIEMYIATNSSASDTVVLNAAPQDKSIFFIAVPRGTLGVNNLVLQTNDIQFNNVIVKKTYNEEGIKIKYAPNSLISIYRNGSNAYVYNVPMVL